MGLSTTTNSRRATGAGSGATAAAQLPADLANDLRRIGGAPSQ